MKVFSSDKGFTILETMVAIAILAVGTLGVGSMLMISLDSGRIAAETRRAESIAMQRLEALKTTQGVLAGGNAEVEGKYAFRWDVANYQWLDTSQNSGLRQLDVTVGWPIDVVKYPACTAANPENCQYRFAVSTYFRPLPIAP